MVDKSWHRATFNWTYILKPRYFWWDVVRIVYSSFFIADSPWELNLVWLSRPSLIGPRLFHVSDVRMFRLSISGVPLPKNENESILVDVDQTRHKKRRWELGTQLKTSRPILVNENSRNGGTPDFLWIGKLSKHILMQDPSVWYLGTASQMRGNLQWWYNKPKKWSTVLWRLSKCFL